MSTSEKQQMYFSTSKTLLVLVLIFGFGAGASFPQEERIIETTCEKGVLGVRADQPATVEIDNKFKGKTKAGEYKEFCLRQGKQKIKILSEGKTIYKGIVNVVDSRTLIKVEHTSPVIVDPKPCPFDVGIVNPDEVVEGDLTTFAAFNVVTGVKTKLQFRWKVSPKTVKITKGLGTSVIVVDTKDFGGESIFVDLGVSGCETNDMGRQLISSSVEVFQLPKIIGDPMDEFPTISDLDDKARIDGLAIDLEINPTVMGYIIIYQGEDSLSRERNATKLSKLLFKYLTKKRGVSEKRIKTVIGKLKRKRTTYQIWLVPPGAELPEEN